MAINQSNLPKSSQLNMQGNILPTDPFTNFFEGVGNLANDAKNGIVNGINAVGKQIGNTHVLPFAPPGIPNPTYSQTVGAPVVTTGPMGGDNLNPMTPLLKGNATGMGIVGLGMLGFDHGANPEEDATDETTAESTAAKGMMPPSELNKFNLPKAQLDMNSPAKVSDIKATLDEVPGSTWSDKNQNMAWYKDNLENQIKTANDVKIPIADYQNAGEARLKPLITAGKLTPLQAKQAVTSWIGRIYDAAQPTGDMPSVMNIQNGTPEGGQTAAGLSEPQRYGYNGAVQEPSSGTIATPQTQGPPEFIDKNTAVNMHRANNDAVSTFYNADGSVKANLSPEDEATLQLRNASSDVLRKNAPQVNDLLIKQSHLYKSDNVVGRLAQDEQDAQLKAANQPQEPQPSTIEKIGDFAKNAALPLAITSDAISRFGINPSQAVETGLKAGSDLLSYISNPFGKSNSNNQGNSNVNNPFAQNSNNPQNSNSHSFSGSDTITPDQTISQSGQNVKAGVSADNTGHFQISPMSNQNQYMTLAQKQQAQARTGGPNDPAWRAIEQQYNDSQQSAQNKLKDVQQPSFFNNVQNTYVPVGNKVFDDFAQIPPNVTNGIAHLGDLKAYAAKSPNDPWSHVLSDVSGMNLAYTAAYREATGERLNPDDNQLIQMTDSPAQAYNKWQSMMSFYADKYNSVYPAYLATTNPSGTEVAPGQGAPVTFSGGSSFNANGPVGFGQQTPQ